MAFCGTVRNLFYKFAHKKPVLLLVSSRSYTLKYVNPKRFSLEEKTILKEEDPRSVKFIEKHGKAWHLLNESRSSSLAHTISADFDCLEGISRDFALKFPDTENLKELDNPLGSTRVLENGEHFIYYLIIRENWWDRGAYRPMRESLTAMRDHALKNKVKNITMGRLGSHKDGLDFREILKDLKAIFYDTDIDLTIYSRRT